MSSTIACGLRIAIATACVLTTVARAADAQTLEGRVAESPGGRSVAGAVVSLLGPTGTVVARTVSRPDGGYSLSTTSATPGATAVRVTHIGFAPASLPMSKLSLAPGATIELTRLPTLLDAVVTLDQPLCQATPGRPDALALWEQAREALLATIVAREVNPATVRMVGYNRLTGPDGMRIQRQTLTESVFVASASITSHRTANSYELLGYRDAIKEQDTDRYYGADADALLDPAFAPTHCLSVRRNDARHPDQLGLEFRPAKGVDSIVDVAGVIWIGRTNPSLQSVEFRFTNVNRVSAGVDSMAGGGTWYQEMPNGLVVPVRWELRVPIAQGSQPRLSDVDVRARAPRVDGFQLSGGELANASWRDGATWDAGLPRIRGHVVAGTAEAPVVGAVVELRGTRMHATTDSSGAFAFPPVPAGPYGVDAFDQSLVGVNLLLTASVELRVDRSLPDTATIILPSRAKLVDSVCSEGQAHSSDVRLGSTLLIGRVLLPSGEPAIDALVRARWNASDGGATALTLLQGRADSSGTFQICGAPSDSPLTLSATNDSLVSAELVTRVRGKGGIANVVMPLVRLGEASLPAFRRRSIQVNDDASNLPLAAVEVIDGREDRVIGRTSDQGTLSLATVPEGTTMLRVRKPGYEQRALMIAVQPGDSAPVTLKLRTVTQLAAVHITATSVSRRASVSGIDDRVKMKLGHFMLPDELDRRGSQPFDAVMRSLGLRTLERGFEVILLGGHTVGSIGGCPVTIYMDGVLYFSGVGGAPPPDAHGFITSTFSAVEYYADAATIPIQFSATDSGCGVLLLWTK